MQIFTLVLRLTNFHLFQAVTVCLHKPHCQNMAVEATKVLNIEHSERLWTSQEVIRSRNIVMPVDKTDRQFP